MTWVLWPLVLKFKVFDLRLCFHFIKYCKEIPGKSMSSYLLMNINDLGAMAVSSQV